MVTLWPFSYSGTISYRFRNYSGTVPEYGKLVYLLHRNEPDFGAKCMQKLSWGPNEKTPKDTTNQFQHDNSTVQKARSMKLRSPELNLTVHLWDEVKSMLHSRSLHSTSVLDFTNAPVAE